MWRSAQIFVLILLLVAVNGGAVYGAEQWSTPVVTKPWSESLGPEEEAPPQENVLPPSQDIDTEMEQPPSWIDDLWSASTQEDPSPPQDYRELLGTWYIWTPGAVKSIYDNEGKYVGHQLGQGAAQGIIVLNQDGTYSMSHGAWNHGTTITGEWRLSYPREINGEILQGIVLPEGISRSDWAVAPSSNGKMRLLWAMYWADGSATWVYDSELVR